MGGMPTLRAGFGRADITPARPVPLAGFAHRDQPSAGVAHRIHVRAALLDRDGTRTLIVAADLLGWPTELADELRAELSGRFGVAPEGILLAASHTHSAPQVATWMAPSIGRYDPAATDLVRRQVSAAVEEAGRTRRPVTVRRRTARHELGTHRRQLVDGEITMGLDPAGPTDPELTAVVFHGADGTPHGALVHYTCHPVISDRPEVSGDFTGAAMSLLENETPATCLFLQGCCGDINPGTLACAGPSEVDRQAAALAGRVRPLLSADGPAAAPVPLTAAWREADLPLDHRPDAAEIDQARRADGVLGEWGTALAGHPERVTDTMRLRAQRLDLADGVALLAMNGEATVGYGLAVRHASAGRALPVGYANGMIGYLPSASQLAEGGYEADGSTRYYLLPSRYSPAIEPVILDTVRSLVDPA